MGAAGQKPSRGDDHCRRPGTTFTMGNEFNFKSPLEKRLNTRIVLNSSIAQPFQNFGNTLTTNCGNLQSIIDSKINVICHKSIGKREVLAINQHWPASYEQAMGEKTGIVHFTQEIRDRLQKRTLFENNIQNIIPLAGWHSGLPPVSYWPSDRPAAFCAAQEPVSALLPSPEQDA